MEIRLNQVQLDWLEAMVARYFTATGIHISPEQVLMRTLEYGYSISENEMAAIEQNLHNPFLPKKYGDLKLVRKP